MGEAVHLTILKAFNVPSGKWRFVSSRIAMNGVHFWSMVNTKSRDLLQISELSAVEDLLGLKLL